jgi:mono/diheme cytochrome c family protein
VVRQMTKALSVFIFATSMFIPAAFGADINRGRDLAERWCVDCHLVNSAQRRTTEAPPFAVVANRGVDAQRLAYFLLNPHPVMPNMGLSRSEAADLAAYIVSLGK